MVIEEKKTQTERFKSKPVLIILLYNGGGKFPFTQNFHK